ncbi:MAG: phosphate ABC transporter permease PstA [Kiritimatiellaeota bacterium]|nr:phosphate ABC transporter permease PstA [Kiritimatiellota bacterium]
MNATLRHLHDRLATGLGFFTLLLMGAALGILLLPILWRGAGAVVFRATCEHRRMLYEQFGVGGEADIRREAALKNEAFRPVFDAMKHFEDVELPAMPMAGRREMRAAYAEFQDALRALHGPLPGEPRPVLARHQYGAARMDKAREALRRVLFEEHWEYPLAEDGAPLPGRLVETPRADLFKGTEFAKVFEVLAARGVSGLLPRPTFYWRFFTLASRDAHFFGGIWPELKGTFFLAVLAMLFAAPTGILAAVWLTEYARQGRLISLVRACVNTLAGVPSVVFGLFGLAFFIVALRVSAGKSVLAGGLTLALLVLPTMIRSAEEAIAAVPVAYREAALGLGAGKWRGIVTVVLPAALPGILTGVVICMGRVAGETAPVIFTAVVSAGPLVRLANLWNSPTPALSWNIYNLVSEHEAADELRHVQYGMVATLVLLVLSLNLAAIVLRARVSKKLHG